jgi:hypothetical protein
VHPDISELQPRLKEILYDCAVEIRATKAALFLWDGGARRFELATEYGFRGQIRQTADLNDPLIDRCGRGRSPFFINGLATEPRFSELLYESGTDRLLAAPIYSRGQLVGVIDMRDKAGRQPFEDVDLRKAQLIADRMLEVFGGRNLFGQRFITLAEVKEHAPLLEMPKPVPPVEAPRPAAKVKPAPPPHQPRIATLVLEARGAASRLLLSRSPDPFTETELAIVRDFLRSILLIPGAAVAMFSAWAHLGGIQEIAAKGTLAADAIDFVQTKLNIWLMKRGDSGGTAATNVTTPFGTAAPPIAAAALQKVFTAPIAGGYLTVAFMAEPDRTAHELLAGFHRQLQFALEQSIAGRRSHEVRAHAAATLLEPPFTNFPELRKHSDAVAARCEAFAQFLAMPPAEAEELRLLATVHDCGMRLLDYERLYRKKDLSQDELSILQEHVAVGAALVAPLLGDELAYAVLCHHERADGRGYPNGIGGEAIPLLTRILRICDAYEAMTAPDSYQPPQQPDRALRAIADAAGAQFDAELAHRFVDFARRR